MKKTITDLAGFGGAPLFADKVHIGRPNLCAREKIHAALDEIFDRRWLTNDGPFVRRFEEQLQQYLGVKHCITVCNATIGLQMVYRALGIPRHSGSAVMPSFTFIATAHALAWEGGHPVFCDVDRSTHLVSPADMESKINADTTLLVGVHTWGQPCNVEQLESLSKSRRIPLVFDAAHAFANRAGSRFIGGFGDAEVFSFHATKFLNSFEGGMISTNHDGLAAELKYMRNFGFAGIDNVCALGTNGKMSEISAAMGLCMLEEIDQLLEINRRNYHCYHQAFDGCDEFSLLKLEQPDSLNCQYITGTVSEDAPEFVRDMLVDILWQENVLSRRYFYPGVHRSAPYSGQEPACSLPVTDDLCRRIVVFPTGSAVRPEDIEKLAGCVRFVLKNADEIHRRRGGHE